MKFLQNETDVVVIGIDEKELSISLAMVLHVEFITIFQESIGKEG